MKPFVHHEYLKRLDASAYRGRAYVHWSMTTKDRRAGWLNSTWHAIYREVLLHVCVRYELVSPVYCVMPDHLHLLLVGRKETSDQRKAVRMLRQVMTARTKDMGFAWQQQAHDSVLREEDRQRDAFPHVVGYVRENPERAGLVKEREEWPFAGAMIPGYPDLDWRRKDFWDVFWKAT